MLKEVEPDNETEPKMAKLINNGPIVVPTLFTPPANNVSFPLMISGLFIVALGFSLQQTAANPLAITMGDPRKGSQRLSLAGGVNNVGTTIGPLLISFAIFGSVSVAGTTSLSIENIKVPYLILGAAFLIVAVIFKFSSIPNKIESISQDAPQKAGVEDKKSALKYPQLVLGMIAIFVYVGVEENLKITATIKNAAPKIK